MLAVGMDHVMIVDQGRQLWSLGENNNGAMGTGDNKARLTPWRVLFYENKRIVDVACGNRFTVVIAETFNTPKPLIYSKLKK
jgi:alpha-tubulin suppressor-like RCC1 family protein